MILSISPIGLISTLIISTIILVALCFAIVAIIKGKSKCSCGCGSCPYSSSCNKNNKK